MGFPLMVRAIRLSLETPTAGWNRPRPPSAPVPGGCSSPSPCRWPGPAWSPAPCWRSPRHWAEFGATITFVSNIPGETQTLSSAIYGLMQVPGGEGGIWRLAAVAVAISLIALLLSEWLTRRHRGREET